MFNSCDRLRHATRYHSSVLASLSSALTQHCLLVTSLSPMSFTGSVTNRMHHSSLWITLRVVSSLASSMARGKMEASLGSGGGHVRLFSVKWDTDGKNCSVVLYIKEMPRKLFRSIQAPKRSFRLMSWKMCLKAG